MTKKIKKGFTLTELIVVIAIIAILAAVLIPTSISFIKKAKLSNDVSDAKNMTTQLTSYALLNDIDLSKLTASDVRYIVNESSDVKYTFKSRVKDYHFWYNSDKNLIEVLKFNEVVSAENNDRNAIEEVFEGKHLLDTEGSDLARALYGIRNLTSINLFVNYLNLLEQNNDGENYSEVINYLNEQFALDKALYVNNRGSVNYDKINKSGTDVVVQNIVFANDMSIIPEGCFEGIDTITNNVVIPTSIKCIENGAFSTVTNANIIAVNSSSVKAGITAFNDVLKTTNPSLIRFQPLVMSVAKVTFNATYSDTFGNNASNNSIYKSYIINAETAIYNGITPENWDITFSPQKNGNNCDYKCLVNAKAILPDGTLSSSNVFYSQNQNNIVCKYTQDNTEEYNFYIEDFTKDIFDYYTTIKYEVFYELDNDETWTYSFSYEDLKQKIESDSIAWTNFSSNYGISFENNNEIKGYIRAIDTRNTEVTSDDVIIIGKYFSFKVPQII